MRKGEILRFTPQGIYLQDQIGETLEPKEGLLKSLMDLLEMLIKLKGIQGDRAIFEEWKKTIKTISVKRHQGLSVSDDKTFVFIYGEISTGPKKGWISYIPSSRVVRYPLPASWSSIRTGTEIMDRSYNVVYDITNRLSSKLQKPCYKKFQSRMQQWTESWNAEPYAMYPITVLDIPVKMHTIYDRVFDLRAALLVGDHEQLANCFESLVQPFEEELVEEFTLSYRRYTSPESIKRSFCVLFNISHQCSFQPVSWTRLVVEGSMRLSATELINVFLPLASSNMLVPYLHMFVDEDRRVPMMDGVTFPDATSDSEEGVTRLQTFVRYFIACFSIASSSKCCERCKDATRLEIRSILMEHVGELTDRIILMQSQDSIGAYLRTVLLPFKDRRNRSLH